MKTIPDCIRFKGTHMTGCVLVIYGEEPHRLLRIRWDECPAPDTSLYHESEIEPVEKREHSPSRLYESQEWGKYQREEARLKDLKAGYSPMRSTRG
jgi:hypothetical protein